MSISTAEVPSTIPELETANNLKAGLFSYVDQAKKDNIHLGYLDETETEALKERAFALAMERFDPNKTEGVGLSEIILMSVNVAAKEIVPWVYMDDMPDFKIQTVDALELHEDKTTVEKMVEIIKENYKDKPPEFIREIITGFMNSLNNQRTEFYVAKQGETIVSFCRFDDHTEKYGAEGHVYFGSVNLNPHFKYARLGESLIQAALNEERDGLLVPVKADCQAYGSAGQNYIEKYGFSA